MATLSKRCRARSIVAFSIAVAVVFGLPQGRMVAYAANGGGWQGAYSGYFGGASQGLWPFGGGYGLYSRLPDLDKLPHFALFPPVYYSSPIPRSYGGSPYASLPDFTTGSAAQPVQPLVVTNPYVTTTRTGGFSTAAPAQRAQIVRNPFVTPARGGSESVARLADK